MKRNWTFNWKSECLYCKQYSVFPIQEVRLFESSLSNRLCCSCIAIYLHFVINSTHCHIRIVILTHELHVSLTNYHRECSKSFAIIENACVRCVLLLLFCNTGVNHVTSIIAMIRQQCNANDEMMCFMPAHERAYRVKQEALPNNGDACERWE